MKACQKLTIIVAPVANGLESIEYEKSFVFDIQTERVANWIQLLCLARPHVLFTVQASNTLGSVTPEVSIEKLIVTKAAWMECIGRELSSCDGPVHVVSVERIRDETRFENIHIRLWKEAVCLTASYGCRSLVEKISSAILRVQPTSASSFQS